MESILLKMKKINICFVLLHYTKYELTDNCIRKIFLLHKNDECSVHIIVVDNASPDGSGHILFDKYKNCEAVDIVLLEKNIGFARGNNIGYDFARKHYSPDYIVVANTDVIFDDVDFCDKLKEHSNHEKAYIIGPDIVTTNGEHQNPHRKSLLTKKQLQIYILTKLLGLTYYSLKSVPIFHNIVFFDKIRSKRSNSRIENNSIKVCEDMQDLENPVLHGACMIYTSLWIRKYRIAYLPYTFLYGEEDFLAYFCKKNNLKCVYDTNIRVLHLCCESSSKGDTVKTAIFTYKNILLSYLKLYRYGGYLK